MINKFQIGNFKAFSDLQTIPLKPITIIFGPNSSGKSSVIHSLLLARHGVDTKSLDPTYPSIAGKSVDLGGFRQYIHRRNPENRLQCIMELSVKDLPPNVASDLAMGDTLSIHLNAGIKLDDRGQPLPGATPFTQTCEYRIDGDIFLRFARKERGSDFMLAQLNRDHAVFEPLLQAMLLSSNSLERALKDDMRNRLVDLIDDVITRVRVDGSSDFLPAPAPSADFLQNYDRHIANESPDDDYAQLGDLARSVRLFLPRALLRIHAAIINTVESSLQSLIYLGPLRSFPPRHMALADSDTFGHPASGALAWKELARNDNVRDKVNHWLSKLKTPYILELERYFSGRKIEDITSQLYEKTVPATIRQFLKQASSDNHYKFLIDSFIQQASMSEDEHRELAEWLDKTENQLRGQSEHQVIGSEHKVFKQEKVEISDEEVERLIKQAADIDKYEQPGDLDSILDVEEEFSQRVLPLLEKLFIAHADQDAIDITLFDINKKTPVSHRDVGIGVSQVLPVLVQAYASKNALVAMEQPEIHLHPALQADLGDVFIESALGEQQNRFVLETHSEHLILRILRRIRESAKQEYPTITASDVAVLYVEPSPDGAEVFEMEISEDGQIVSQWPGGFFPERMKEMFGEI